MAALTKKEILTQLKKLGINSTPEIKNYLEEYKEYCSPQNLHFHSPEQCRERISDNSHDRRTVVKRFARQVRQSVFPVIINFPGLSKARVFKRIKS